MKKYQSMINDYLDGDEIGFVQQFEELKPQEKIELVESVKHGITVVADDLKVDILAFLITVTAKFQM